MSRTTIIALTQTLAIFVGFFALAVVLKMSGYPDSFLVRWNPIAVFLREHGFWLLLIPVGWGFFATAASAAIGGFSQKTSPSSSESRLQ